MRVTIHQPEHFPWLGFFHKIAQVDSFIILDNVQFRKNYFQNRNKIRTSDGWAWFTVPVNRSLDTLIKDVFINKDSRWKKKWCDSVYFNYSKAPHFEAYFRRIADIVDAASYNLYDLNIALIRLVCELTGVKTKFLFASELSAGGKGSSLILNLCKKVHADEYLSGISGKDYLQLEDFTKAGIKINFQEFHHPIYRQLHEPFIPCMSIIDLLFNYGEKSLDIINGKGISVMEEVFL